LHWLSALAVTTAFAGAWTRAAIDDPGHRASLMLVHQCAGLLVMGLLLLRVGTRLANWSRRPRHPLPRVLAFASLAGHVLLYGLLLAMPLLGWALTNAHGHAVRLPGLPALPALTEADPDLADTLDSWHVGISWVLLAIVGLHVVAALFHHFVLRDGVLASMLPAASRDPMAKAGKRYGRETQGSRSF
jgi:cytochrome b561